jgi:hypothetical protein
MIEKPLALSYQEATALQQYSTPILINHIHLFSEPYQTAKQAINPSTLQWIQTCGGGDNPLRDYSDLWDWGAHDLAMILDLAQTMPLSVQCWEPRPRWFQISLEFKTFSAWCGVGQTPNGEKIRSLSVSDHNITYECKNMLQSTFEPPLINAIRVFLAAIHGRSDSRLGLDLSFKVLQILEKCQESLLIK